MKRFCSSLAVATIGASALLSPSLPAQQAEIPYRVANIRETNSKDLIKVGKNWRKDLSRRLVVTLRVPEATPSKGLKVAAYFYDKDNNLIHTTPSPSLIWTSTKRGFEEVGMPATLEKGKANDIYFALPEEVTSKNWKSVVVVFGKGKEFSARVRPGAKLDGLEFPEKQYVVAEEK